MHIVLLSVVLGSFLPLLAVAGNEKIFAEDFNSDAAGFKTRGWFWVRANVVKEDGFPCLELSNDHDGKVSANCFIKVKPGKRYTISCRIKTQGVSTEIAGFRQASVFAEWADTKLKYVSGGMFPKGLGGTESWREFAIPFTNTVPDGVGYINIYLALEGKGRCWFKDLEVREFDQWKGIPAISPSNEAAASETRPLLKWQAMENCNWEVMLATNPHFTQNLKRFNVGNRAELLIPEFLPRGSKWFWQAQGTVKGNKTPEVYATPVQSFTVAANADSWPVILKPRYEWSALARPQLTVAVEGEAMETTITVDGIPARIVRNGGSVLVFQPGQDLKPGLHKINFKLTSSRKQVQEISNTYCNNLPGAKVSWKNGITYVDGKPFFPIGCFRDPSDKTMEFSGIAEAGFNLAHSYYFHDKKSTVEKAREYLDAARKNNVMAFLSFNRQWIDGHDREQITAYVSELMTHPALLSWYLYDEPERLHVPVDSLKFANNAVKETDPFHPTLIVSHAVDVISQVSRDYSTTADSFSCDPYPGESRKPISLVYNWVNNCRKMVGSDRPVWAVIETFDVEFWKGRKKYKKVKEFGPVKKPSYEELRCMTYLALAGGADGIIYYWLPSWAYNIRQDAPEVWGGVCRMVKELKSLEPYMTTPRPADISGLKLPSPFFYWLRKNAQGQYLLAVINAEKEAAELKQEIKLPGGKPLNVSGRFAPREVKIFYVK